jgi:hypothetical protein
MPQPRGDAAAHRVADDDVGLKFQHGGELGHVARIVLERIAEMRAALGEAAAAHIEHIGVEGLAEALADEAPGDRRAGDAGHEDQRPAAAAVAQVVLADAVCADVRAVPEGRRALRLTRA